MDAKESGLNSLGKPKQNKTNGEKKLVLFSLAADSLSKNGQNHCWVHIKASYSQAL